MALQACKPRRDDDLFAYYSSTTYVRRDDTADRAFATGGSASSTTFWSSSWLVATSFILECIRTLASRIKWTSTEVCEGHRVHEQTHRQPDNACD